MLDVLRPVNREGLYEGETKCIPTTSKILIHYLKHIPPLKIWRNLEKLTVNELRRQKLGRYISLVSRNSTQSYILTYYRLRKMECLIALGSQSHQGGL